MWTHPMLLHYFLSSMWVQQRLLQCADAMPWSIWLMTYWFFGCCREQELSAIVQIIAEKVIIEENHHKFVAYNFKNGMTGTK
jgi:hypothetical protein